MSRKTVLDWTAAAVSTISGRIDRPLRLGIDGICGAGTTSRRALATRLQETSTSRAANPG